MCYQNCEGLLKSATKTAKDCSFMTVDKMQSELPPEAYSYLNLCKIRTTLKAHESTLKYQFSNINF